MKKLISLFLLALTSLGNFAFASNNIEEINLVPDEIVKITTPISSEIIYATNSKKTNIQDKKSISIYRGDDVFESKTGQFFSNFINDKVIHNKFSKFTYDDDEQ